MARHNDYGCIGEDKAAGYLEAAGFVILERNWRIGRREIDIICSRDSLLIVVEVKTRRTFDERPEDLLNLAKCRNIRAAAEAYMKVKGIETEVRFDLILLTGNDLEVQHIPDAIQIF